MIKKRMRPGFIIIGGVKCASTSLFRYLVEHPNVLPGTYKEPTFFNNRSLLRAILRYPKYIKNFPLVHSSDQKSLLNWPVLSKEGEIIETKLEKQRVDGRSYITGEASATYNFSVNPFVIKTLLPKVKILFLLRNPTDRFISHWKMFQRFHKEGRKGYDVGDLVPFIKKEIEAFQAGKPTRMIHQGMYSIIINKWQQYFHPGQFLVLKNTDLDGLDRAKQTMTEVTSFLDLPDFDYSEVLADRFNVAPKEDDVKEAVELLDAFYAVYNEQLEKSHGIKLTD